MTHNRDTEAAWRYHNLTKHSYRSIRADRHYLDWSNQPLPFKIYPSIDPMPLPVDFASTGKSALETIASSGIAASRQVEPTIEQMASLLVCSAGVMKEKKYLGGSFYFRAAACAGALYPTEVYLVCRDLDGLPAGVYHFNPGDFALRRLREGDFRRVLARATADESRVRSAPVTLVFTAISWRSTWKYRDRAYRYHFWDNGMILANALAMAAAHELPAEVVMGFVEAEVNKLIGTDGKQELALSLLALGHDKSTLPEASAAEDLPEISLEVLPISRAPVDYPSIREMHFASSFTDRSEVSDWRAAALDFSLIAVEGEEFTLAAMHENRLPQEAIEAVIERRASTRRFARKPMPLADLSTIIDRATRGIPTDCLPSGGAQLNDIYAIVNRVEGLPPGAYFYRSEDRTLELLKPGEFSKKAAYLTLEQDLGGDACATFFFMADLKSVLEAYGNRGYRVAQMEAGIIGGKLYVAAYALGRGATGLTFYDDDVTEFFSPHAAGKSCIFVVSVGIPGKRPLM